MYWPTDCAMLIPGTFAVIWSTACSTLVRALVLEGVRLHDRDGLGGLRPGLAIRVPVTTTVRSVRGRAWRAALLPRSIRWSPARAGWASSRWSSFADLTCSGSWRHRLRGSGLRGGRLLCICRHGSSAAERYGASCKRALDGERQFTVRSHQSLLWAALWPHPTFDRALPAEAKPVLLKVADIFPAGPAPCRICVGRILAACRQKEILIW